MGRVLMTTLESSSNLGFLRQCEWEVLHDEGGWTRIPSLVEPHCWHSRSYGWWCKIYFDNIWTEHFFKKFLEVDEIVGTLITLVHELSIFVIYTLWRILSFRRINFPSLILNRKFQCQNQRSACLPFARLLTSLFFQSWENMSQRLTSIITPNMVNYNDIFCKLVLRENKKRKTSEASSSRTPLEEPTP